MHIISDILLRLCGLRPWLGDRPSAVAVFTLFLATAMSAQSLRINELQPANDRTLVDEDGETSDWIELWNGGTTAFELGGCGLSDNAGAPFKWVFAPNTPLASAEFLVVFASGKDRQPSLAPAVNPTQFPGLRVWLRADAVDPSNTAQVRKAGTTVFLRRWEDYSGHGNYAAQPLDNLQPRWLAPAAGSSAALRFDGANDLLRLPRPAGTNDFCVFAVCRTSQAHEVDPEDRSGTGGTSGQHWLFGATHGGDLDAGAGISIGTNGISVYEHGSGYMPALVAYQRPIGAGLQVIAVNYAARQPSLDHQGLAVRPGLLSPRRQVWAPVEIGSGSYGAFGGELMEVLVFNRALSLDERRGIARHLAERYSASLPLPRHTNFQLSAAGERVVLTHPDGTRLDQASFGAVPRDVSYGRSLDDAARWNFYARPTPGATNGTPGTTEWLFPPTLSHEGGFYSNAFELTLTSANLGAEVRYTLDGAEPATNSTLYSAPIPIRSRAGTPNNLSAIPTVPGGQRPASEVFKGWVVRARAFQSNAMPSAIITRTYWVHAKGPSRYSLPVVALTADRRSFFDPAIGIYVPGNASGGNYSQRGPEWERPVHVEFYETDHRLVLAQDGDVKIHGNTSQNFPIKGLDLDATAQPGRQPFRHRIFPNRNRSAFDHVLLRPSGHDHYMAFMRDELMQELGAETGAESQAARLCIVFLNGEYWGLHYLKEKEDAEFVSFYADLPVEDLDYLEGYAGAKMGDTIHYDALVRFLAENDPATTANYQKVQTLMDVPNYIDYKACEIFNYRWDIGNHRLWRPRTPEGRWRWFQFDNDVGWGGFAALQPGWGYDMLTADLTVDGRLNGHNNETTTFLLRRLVLNAQFRQDFINRFADLLNTVWLPTNTLAHVNVLAARLAPEMAEHCQRWRVPASLADWQKAVESFREFARRRPNYSRDHLRNYFKLPGTAPLSLEVVPPGAGTLQVNTLSLAFPTNAPWRGTYFRSNPIRLVARPLPGYIFSGWTGVQGIATNGVTLLLQGDTTLTALFLPEVAPPVQLEARLRAPAELVLSLSAPPGTRWTLETSHDLESWATAETLTLDIAGHVSTTLSVQPTARQFFRARLP